MASVADLTGEPLPAADAQPTLARLIDHWIYVFMAALFLVTVLVGFIPDSLFKVEMVKAGQRPPFPVVLHVHAVLMGSWLLLLLAQTSLVATGREALHQSLGIASMVLAPAIIITGFVLVPTMFHQVWYGIQNGPPAVQAQLRPVLGFVTNISLVQIGAGLLFAIFVTWGIMARRKDHGLHKRMMILAIAMPLAAAIDRITWLPSTMPANPLTTGLYPILWIMPMFLWDLARLGRVHRAYLIFFAFVLPVMAIQYLLWGTPLWTSFVPRLMGVA